MKNIARHTEYLLTLHDCVVVPGLGSFVKNDEAANYDSVRREFIPPCRMLAFNPEVRHNDAMLIGSIAREQAISQTMARKQLENEIAAINHQLRQSGEVMFGNLGLLTRAENAEYPVFEPFDESLPLRRYEGLKPVCVRPIEIETIDSHVSKDSEEKVRVIPLPLKIVASIAMILVTLGILYSTTSLVKGPMINYASLDTGLNNIDMRPDNGEAFAYESLSREIILNIAVPEEKEGVDTDISATRGINSPASDKIADKFILVVASFKTPKQAERYIVETGDPYLNFIEMDGNYRIYAASAPTREDAELLLQDVALRYPDVWICRN